MRILILGGTRFIGPHLVGQLLEAGHDVTVFNRGRAQGRIPDTVPRITGDRRAISQFLPEFRKIAPETVIDMCAYSEAEAASLMNIFRGVARRVVVLSSMDVYRGWDRFFKRDASIALQAAPFHEESPLRQRFYPRRDQAVNAEDWQFHYEKILVERTVLNDPALPGTVLRLASIYGPGDHQRRLFDFVKRMDDDRPAILINEARADWLWTWGYVENVARAVVLAATDERASGQIYNIGEERARTQLDWARKLAVHIGWRGKLVLAPEAKLPSHLRENQEVDYSQDLALDSTKIGRELNFADRVPFEIGLARAVEWLRASAPAAVDPKEFDYAAEDACLRAQMS